jgi:hypothetical protein
LKYTDFLQDPQGRQSKDVDGHSLSEGNTWRRPSNPSHLTAKTPVDLPKLLTFYPTEYFTYNLEICMSSLWLQEIGEVNVLIPILKITKLKHPRANCLSQDLTAGQRQS